MDEELISKKDLLDYANISYGQLYRWKRKSLIPDDWFIRKSTFTGQETFFPKNKILERIDKIKNMKDDLSLDDIADMFSPQLADVLLSKDELKLRNIVSQMALEIYEGIHGETKVFSFEKILYISLLESCLSSGEVSLEEGKNILNTIEKNYKKFEARDCEIILFRKFGISICIITLYPYELVIEDAAKLVININVGKAIEELKLKI
ncbi:YhbD family protein [Clostridium omnivorum]|uniref:DUF4004 family protein n=1 Tax=Clostridium omnivorum TaxID=1604902 RepID=A0ABQ5N5Y7_9CLOT|nr:YhbD family protein [Clostridium sp. E14]GLC30445.1 hypothetical protein bsdE14_18550 [Clostridium sp. E14]